MGLWVIEKDWKIAPRTSKQAANQFASSSDSSSLTPSTSLNKMAPPATLQRGPRPMSGTSATRRAACSCGQLIALATGEPVRISVCHCLSCQQRSGSAFAVRARFDQSQVTIEGKSTAFVRVADSGNEATLHFCPTCGDTVYYTMDAVTGFMVIPVGSFADPSFPPPQFSVYETRKHPWLQLTGDLERFD